MPEIKRYQKKPEYVTAFQWDGQPIEGYEIVEYPCGDRRIRQLEVKNTRTQLRFANPGDWILESDDQVREIITDDARFRETWEEIPE